MDLEFGDYFRFVLALAFVLGLIGAAAVMARRLGMAHRGPRRPGAPRRLGIEEVMALDGKRRLVLVRRDDVEHLIVLGVGGDLLVESKIPVSSEPPSFHQMVTPVPSERSPS